MLEIFSSYDEKLQGYNLPFFMPKKAQAIRHFSDGINDPSTQISKHPGDYTLICLGTFDEETGIIEHKKETLCNGIDVLKSETEINYEMKAVEK